MKTINIKGQLVDFNEPLVMGIVNITPDSFYSASRKQDEADIIARIQQIVDEGGKIIDIGGQSSNPKSPFLSAEEEMSRLRYALAIINREFPDITISVDTFYGSVAAECVEKYGVAIINDISGGQIDKDMFKTAARLQVPYILMHMRGTPQDMNQKTDYKNLIQDIFLYFSEKIRELNLLGVNDIIVDPGFGFSKTLDQNYELFAALRGFEILDCPLLVGISRKSMIYNLLGISSAESLNGTTVLNTFALQNGANILRVHDVKAAVEAVKITKKLRQYVF